MKDTAGTITHLLRDRAGRALLGNSLFPPVWLQRRLPLSYPRRGQKMPGEEVVWIEPHL
jgi:hypothetical protein